MISSLLRNSHFKEPSVFKSERLLLEAKRGRIAPCLEQ